MACTRSISGKTETKTIICNYSPEHLHVFLCISYIALGDTWVKYNNHHFIN